MLIGRNTAGNDIDALIASLSIPLRQTTLCLWVTSDATQRNGTNSRLKSPPHCAV